MTANTLSTEQRRALSEAYRYILSLSARKQETTPETEALEGNGAGVAEDTDERQSLSHFTRDCPTMQKSGGLKSEIQKVQQTAAIQGNPLVAPGLGCETGGGS